MVRMKRNFVNESHEIMRTIILGMLGALLATTQSNAEDPTGGNWPRFRGPDGRGIAASQHVPVELGKNTLAWSVPLPGPGSSSPVVWGAALFVTGEDRKKGEVTLVCLDVETGGTRWSKTVRTGDYQTHNMNNTAASTPCLAENLVVFSWYDSVREVAMLSAFSHKGRELWQHEVGAIKVMHGINLQPVVQDGRVLFAHLHQAGGYVAALDAGNGKPVWRREYPQLSNKTTYITPLVRERHGGGKEVVVASASIGVRGLDLATGEETWALSGVFKERTIVSPVDIMAGSGSQDSLLTAGCKNGVFFAVRPPDAAEGGEARVAWHFDKKTPYVPTPVSDGNTLYVLTDGGKLLAVDPASGALRWQQRLRANFYASPLLIGGRLYCLSREGEVFVAEVGKEFKLLSTLDLKPGDEVMWCDSTPAVAHDSLYLRIGARLDCHRTMP